MHKQQQQDFDNDVFVHNLRYVNQRTQECRQLLHNAMQKVDEARRMVWQAREHLAMIEHASEHRIVCDIIGDRLDNILGSTRQTVNRVLGLGNVGIISASVPTEQPDIPDYI